MRPIFIDYIPRWVPIVAGLLIVGGAWFGGNLARFDLQTTTTFAIGLLGVLIVLIFFQGRYYWRGQIKTLSGDGMKYEAVTSVWIGFGRRIAFAATEAKNWAIKGGARNANAGNDDLPTVTFSVRGDPLELNFLNPKLADFDALSAINPAFFGKLRADYPALKSVK